MNADRRVRSFKVDSPESLDERITPSGMTIAPFPAPAAAAFAPHASGAMDKLGPTLNSINPESRAYMTAGSRGNFVSSQAGRVVIPGNLVDVRVSGDLGLAVSRLQSLGMHVTATNAYNGVVEGCLPISSLSATAGDGGVVGLSPLLRPIPRGGLHGR